MSNYICKIGWYTSGTEGLVCVRQTNLNLRDVVVTDMKSLTAAINEQFTEKDKFEFNGITTKDNYYIDMLCKID